jgi:hypothetical protein
MRLSLQKGARAALSCAAFRKSGAATNTNRRSGEGSLWDGSIMLCMADADNKKRSARWNWLLILPALGLLFPAVYARTTPTLFGFPFFYWYQFAWVFLTAAITGLVYFLVKE